MPRHSTIYRGITVFEKLIVHSNPDIHLVSDNEYTCTRSWAIPLLKICEKTKIYITNVDPVNDNIYTKFGLNISILSQDIEQKPNSDVNQGT